LIAQVDEGPWASVTISKDGEHACGIKTDGALWCWGRNAHGQVGNSATGATIWGNVPTRVGAARWRDVSTGREHTCGVQDDGSLWCWGNAGQGDLADGHVGDACFAPQPVRADAGSWTRTFNANCALRDDGTLWCWGTPTPGGAAIPTRVESGAWSFVARSQTGFWLGIRSDEPGLWLFTYPSGGGHHIGMRSASVAGSAPDATMRTSRAARSKYVVASVQPPCG
jgi:hypothetical protein